MINLLIDQQESDRAFRKWVSSLKNQSTFKDYGWLIDGKGVVFTNYGHGEPGEITDQVMLGVDTEFQTGVVKIVRPKTAQGAKGKLTVIGRDQRGRLLLLREGRLQKNDLSRFIKDDFSALSGLSDVPVVASGVRSDRHWYVVADLDAAPQEIVTQTVQFVHACMQARSNAGGSKIRSDFSGTYGYGRDEKGQIITVTRAGGITEVLALQGYVYDELKKIVGENLKKPKRDGYCVDGIIESANLLLEIKTGTFAQNIYEAVGQLHLYPTLIGLQTSPTRAILIPDKPALKPNMAAALDQAGVQIFTYGIDKSKKKPKILFSDQFIARCRKHN